MIVTGTKMYQYFYLSRGTVLIFKGTFTSLLFLKILKYRYILLFMRDYWTTATRMSGMLFENLVFTALHAMQTRSSDENSVRLSNACIVTKRKKDLSRYLYLSLFAKSAARQKNKNNDKKIRTQNQTNI